ncbi:MAG: MFS transporter [Clostridia bacterium]|nr:MFS transporter [Clostridia bacterium]MBN2881970.1 MFS transporter [Clostridia bacterium]
MSGIKRKTLWIFYTISAMYWFSLYSYGSVLSNHASSLGADVVMIGTIAGSYGVAQLILRIPIGFLSDRVQNRKYFIGAGILFCLISGIGLGLSPTPEYMLVFRIMAGIGATSSIILPGYMTETFDEMDSHHAMGNMSASFKLGRTAAIIIGGFIAQFVGSKWAFLAGGIAAGLCLIPWMFLPLDRKHEEKVHRSTREILSVIKDRDLYMSSVIMIFFQFAVFATTYTFTPIMARDMGVSDAMIGILTAVFTIMGVLSAMLSGRIMKRKFGPKKTVLGAFLGSAISFAIMPFTSNPVQLYIMQALVGFSMGFILPVMMAQGLKNIGLGMKDTAMGYLQAIYGLGIIGGPFFMGMVVRYASIEIGYMMVAAVCATGFIVTFIYGKEDRKNGLAKY